MTNNDQNLRGRSEEPGSHSLPPPLPRSANAASSSFSQFILLLRRLGWRAWGLGRTQTPIVLKWMSVHRKATVCAVLGLVLVLLLMGGGGGSDESDVAVAPGSTDLIRVSEWMERARRATMNPQAFTTMGAVFANREHLFEAVGSPDAERMGGDRARLRWELADGYVEIVCNATAYRLPEGPYTHIQGRVNSHEDPSLASDAGTRDTPDDEPQTVAEWMDAAADSIRTPQLVRRHSQWVGNRSALFEAVGTADETDAHGESVFLTWRLDDGFVTIQTGAIGYRMHGGITGQIRTTRR